LPLSRPDEDFSRNAWCEPNLLSSCLILPYSTNIIIYDIKSIFFLDYDVPACDMYTSLESLIFITEPLQLKKKEWLKVHYDMI